MLAQLAAFVGISTVVIVTPGPDTALTVRNSLFGGRRTGVLTACGVVMGLTVWTVATSAGLAALLSASKPAFTAIKLAGAAYLIYLGLHSLREAFRRGEPAREAATRSKLAPRSGLLQGLLSNLGNPKIAVFFTSLLPQFAPNSGATFAWLLALGLLFAAMTLAWLTVYAVAVAHARQLLTRTRVRRWLDGVTGAVIVAFGIGLALESR